MFSMQLPRCEVEGRIDSSCRSRCHFSRRQPSVLIQLALNAVDVEPARSGGSGLNRLLIFLVLALRPLCAHQAAPNSDAFAHSNDDTLFVWLGRCTGGRREVRTVKQSLRVRFLRLQPGRLVPSTRRYLRYRRYRR